jgi:hypothetical protein
MAVRTTEAAVQKIIDYDRTLIPDLTDFIAGASLLVDEVVAIAPLPSSGLLELVERYLAAHLVAITDKQLAAEQVKSLQQTFQYKLTDGLGITHYGTMAMLFDVTKRLSAYNEEIKAGLGKAQLFWAGSDS